MQQPPEQRATGQHLRSHPTSYVFNRSRFQQVTPRCLTSLDFCGSFQEQILLNQTLTRIRDWMAAWARLQGGKGAGTQGHTEH